MKNLCRILKATLLIAISSVVLFSAQTAWAAAIVWEGDVDNDWSTDGNWAGGTAPGTGDVATFDGTGDVNCTIDANINVGGIDINSGYTQTITQATGVEVLLGASGYDQADGNFVGGNSWFSINGTWTLSGGVITSTSGIMDIEGAFTHTAGGTFNHNNGSVYADGNSATWDVDSSETFYNLTIKKNGTLAFSGDTINVLGTLIFDNGIANNGTLNAQGNVSVLMGADAGGSALLNFTHPSANQTFDLNVDGDASDNLDVVISVNKAGGSVILASDLNMDAASQDLTITAGILATAGNTLSATGGTFSNNGTLRILGNETINLTNDTNSGTVEYVGNGDASQTDYTLKDWTYFGLKVNMTDAVDTLSDSGSRPINGSFRLDSGVYTATSSITTVAANFAQYGGTFTHNDGTITLTGTANLEITDTLYNVVINSSGNTVSAGSNLVIANDLTITAGTLDVTGSHYDLTIGHNFTNSDTFTAQQGTVTFNDATQQSTIAGNTTFYDFTCTTADKNINFTAGSTQTMGVGGTFTLTGADGNLIELNSTAASVWNLIVNGSTSIDWVDVWYSDASGGSAIDPGDNSNDGGFNTNWSFNTVPTISGVTGTGATDGSGQVTISMVVDDADDDDTQQAYVEYYAGGSWTKATMSETSGTSATYGNFNVENDNVHQLGNSNGYITTSSGVNTITATWASATDEATADLSIKIKFYLVQSDRCRCRETVCRSRKTGDTGQILFN